MLCKQSKPTICPYTCIPYREASGCEGKKIETTCPKEAEVTKNNGITLW